MTDPFNVSLTSGVQTKKVKPADTQEIERQISQTQSEWTAADSAADEAANSQYSIAQEDFNAEITSLSEEYNQEEISANEEYQAEVDLADGEVSKAEQNYNEASKNYDSVVKSSDASVAKAQQNVSSLKSALSSLQSSSSSNVSYSTEKNMSTNEDLAREKMISDLTASVKKAESELQTTTQKAEEAKRKAEDEKTKAQADLENAKQNAAQAKAQAEDTKNARVQTALNKRTQGEQAANNVYEQTITQADQTASEEKAKNEATYKPQVDALEAQKQDAMAAEQEERTNSRTGHELAMARDEAKQAYDSAKRAFADYEKLVGENGIIGAGVDKLNAISPFEGVDSVEGYRESIEEMNQLAQQAKKDYDTYIKSGKKPENGTVQLSDE